MPSSARLGASIDLFRYRFVALHELELSNALELKVFLKQATPAQTKTTIALIAQDARAGVLHRPQLIWDDVLKEATMLARTRTRTLGCRSLDILHCAAADSLSATCFVTTDARQRKLALKIGLACPSV